MAKAEVNATYRHFKGGLYRVLHIGQYADNLNECVIYENMNNHLIFVRERKEFESPVDKEKYPEEKQVERFLRVNVVDDISPIKQLNSNPYSDVVNDLYKIYLDKNRDYGSSFSETFKDFGIVAPVIRLSDKVNRIKQLVKSKEKPKVKDESLKDSLKDLANYSILTLIEINREEEK